MFGLSSDTLARMQTVFAHYPQVETVLIYGSRAKGNFRPGSDIDLTLMGSELNNEVLDRILVELDELNTPYMLDVSLFGQIASQPLLQHIERMGKVFYQKNVSCYSEPGS